MAKVLEISRKIINKVSLFIENLLGKFLIFLLLYLVVFIDIIVRFILDYVSNTFNECSFVLGVSSVVCATNVSIFISLAQYKRIKNNSFEVITSVRIITAFLSCVIFALSEVFLHQNQYNNALMIVARIFLIAALLMALVMYFLYIHVHYFDKGRLNKNKKKKLQEMKSQAQNTGEVANVGDETFKLGGEEDED